MTRRLISRGVTLQINRLYGVRIVICLPQKAMPYHATSSKGCRLSTIERAIVRIPYPSRQTVRNVRRIAVGRDALAQITRLDNRAGVVKARCPIESRHVPGPGLVEALGESVTGSCSSGAVLYHLGDRARGAWVLHDDSAGAVLPARGGAVVVLHQAGIGNAVGGGGDADAAAGLLKDNGEDEAVVNQGGGGDGLDGVVDGSHFGGGVVCESVLVT